MASRHAPALERLLVQAAADATNSHTVSTQAAATHFASAQFDLADLLATGYSDAACAFCAHLRRDSFVLVRLLELALEVPGEKLLAGILHVTPELGRAGVRGLPRAWRAAKGWRRLCPGRSRAALQGGGTAPPSCGGASFAGAARSPTGYFDEDF